MRLDNVALAVIEKLNNLPSEDAEIAHCFADDYILGLLELLGYSDVASAFENARTRVGFWYA